MSSIEGIALSCVVSMHCPDVSRQTLSELFRRVESSKSNQGLQKSVLAQVVKSTSWHMSTCGGRFVGSSAGTPLTTDQKFEPQHIHLAVDFTLIFSMPRWSED
jgi:hypothetical protein